MKSWEFFPITPTRFEQREGVALFYGRQEKVGWRFVVRDASGFGLVGPQYQTKDELLNDLPRYAATWGLT